MPFVTWDLKKGKAAKEPGSGGKVGAHEMQTFRGNEIRTKARARTEPKRFGDYEGQHGKKVQTYLTQDTKNHRAAVFDKARKG